MGELFKGKKKILENSPSEGDNFMLRGKRVHVLGLGRVRMGCARGWAQHSAGHTCAQGRLSSPSSSLML